MINKINETFKDIYNAVGVMEDTIEEQRVEIKRLQQVEEVDQLLIKELLGITEKLRKDSYEANEISLKYEDRYFVALVERDEARREICEYQPRYYGTNSVTTEAHDAAERRGWDCYKDEDPRWKSDPRIISLEELERCTRNQTP